MNERRPMDEPRHRRCRTGVLPQVCSLDRTKSEAFVLFF